MQMDGQAFGRTPGGTLGRARKGTMGQSEREGDESSATLREARSRVGTTLNDKWTLESLLGLGGMGAVYAGLHRNGARAAVKVLHHSLAKHTGVRARFLREGYAANRVDHPGVVKVLDDDVVAGGPDAGTAYLVMELLDGESLETRRHRGLALSERDFLLAADAVLDVLEVAHRSGVVHRDIKPDNLFITGAGDGQARVRVLDFGLARMLEGRPMTVFGVAIGTPPFMSPEQAAGRNDEVDGRTDLFALAASGFRLLTGRRIHEGSTPIELVQKMAGLPAPRVQTVAPGMSDVVARVLDRALEFRRDDRYESAAAMRADVRRALSVAPLGSPARALVDGSHAPSIELSASDLEAIKSVELSAIEASQSVYPSARDLEAVPRGPHPTPAAAAEVSVGDAPTSSMPNVPRLARTEPMPAVDAVVPSAPPRTARPRRPSMLVVAAAFGIIVCSAAVAVTLWYARSAAPEAKEPPDTARPTASTRLVGPTLERATKPGKRPKR